MALGALAAFPVLAGGAGGRTPEVPQEQFSLLVEVRYGESLWTLAREHGDPERDVRDLVWRIRRANGVEAGRLRPGSTITIPAECLPKTW